MGGWVLKPPGGHPKLLLPPLQPPPQLMGLGGEAPCAALLVGDGGHCPSAVGCLWGVTASFGTSHPHLLWVMPPHPGCPALPCPATISSSNHALDGKPLCFSSLPRWICPTGSPRRRYECGPTVVSLGGTVGAAGAWGCGSAPGDAPQGCRWWAGRAGCRGWQGLAWSLGSCEEEILLILGHAWSTSLLAVPM